jgi:hypothetical protein
MGMSLSIVGFLLLAAVVLVCGYFLVDLIIKIVRKDWTRFQSQI